MELQTINSKKPRILCVIETLGRGGGVEQLVFSLAPVLHKSGVDIEFLDLFSWHDDLGRDLEGMGFRVHRTNISHRWSIPEGLVKIFPIIKKGHFDLLWGHSYFGNLYVQLAKKLFGDLPSIITLHSEGYSDTHPKSFLARIKCYIEGWLNSKATVKVGVSNAVAIDYQTFFGWDNVKVIYNGVPTRDIPTNIPNYERSEIRKKYGIAKDDFWIIVPARMVKKKGHIYLLRALEILKTNHELQPKATLLSNVGGERDNIKRFISAHGFDGVVSIKSPLAHSDLFKLILAADSVVLPSLREPFGIAAAEAMVTGTPVILTRVDGFIELVGVSQCALMVQRENPQELADAIHKLMLDSHFAEELGARGRQRITDNFDIKISASTWHTLFLATIDNKSDLFLGDTEYSELPQLNQNLDENIKITKD